METKKATLKVNGDTFCINYLGPVEAGTCRVTLDWDDPLMGTTKGYQELAFDAFIKSIGYPSDQWNYPVDAHEVFWIPSYGITMVEPEEADAVTSSDEVRRTHLSLSERVARKRIEFAEEGYFIVRVEDTMDMNEGTITLHYKKEEA